MLRNIGKAKQNALWAIIGLGASLLLFLPAPASAAKKDAASLLFEALEKGHVGDALRYAQRSKDPALLRYAYWVGLKEPASHLPEYIRMEHLLPILKETTHWPEHNKLRLRMERIAFLAQDETRQVRRFCQEFPPISGYGMFACVRAGGLDEAQKIRYITQGWKQGDFAANDAAVIAQQFKKYLHYQHHYERIDRLLYEGKHSAARRLIGKMTQDDQAFFKARMALRTFARDANTQLERLSSARKIDPGIIFERLQWRHKKGLEGGAIEMLLKAPRNPPYANLWWPFRERYAREALSKGRVKDAMHIMADAGEVENANQAEALWALGWMALEHRGDAKAAYEFFYALYQKVNFPVSKARAAFWAGQAAKRNHNHAIAKEWFLKAAQFPTVFYGQLAHASVHGTKPLPLVSNLTPQKLSAAEIKKDADFRLLSLFAMHKKDETLDKFFRYFVETSNNKDRVAKLAGLAQQIGKRYHQVRLAKSALRNHYVLLDMGWPLFQLPKDLLLEDAFALAITRQESEFDANAESSAGARGLMQLLPRTANEVARKMRISYQNAHLWRAEYNVKLGSAYLKRLVNAYDGAIIPAIAAYNAGIGNVRKWQRHYGDPGKNVMQSLLWMESIPFKETRNYVQRVMENLQTYRARIHPQNPNRILQDLTL